MGGGGGFGLLTLEGLFREKTKYVEESEDFAGYRLDRVGKFTGDMK